MNAFWCSVSSTTVVLSSQALGQQYQIQALPPLPGHTESFACGINESGVVVGTSRPVSGPNGRAVRWDNGVPTDLGLLPAWRWAVPLDISTDGLTIVGEAQLIAGGWVAFVWESGTGTGTLTQLPGPAHPVTGCWQINDSGIIVGRAMGATIVDAVACRWEKVGGSWVFTPLPPLPGSSGSFAWGINNDGAIAGASVTLPNWEDSRATTWDGTVPNPAPNLVPGFTGACTIASINDLGQAVGDLQVTPGGAWHAQFHNGAVPTDLGTLIFPNSYAHRINNAGTIVGQSYANGIDPTGFPNDNKRAIIWRAGAMAAVNDLIPAGSNWNVNQLWDLNESGRIVGLGRHNGLWRGCLLIPACYANCDSSTTPPTLNINDFVCFQQRFAAGASYGNCDNSTTPPILNVNDFVCFQQQFAAGCP
jgi:uncharacterized membrane protein